MITRAVPIAVLCLLLGVASTAEAAKKKNVRLRAFKSCSSLVSYGNSNAKRVLGTRQAGGGTGGGGRPVPATGAPGSEGGGTQQDMPAPTAAPDPGTKAPVAGEDFSTTNVQEAGIDEPDIVKTDGKHVFALARGKLRAVDVSGEAPKLVGTLDFGAETWGHTMLLHGDRLLVAWQKSQPQPQPQPQPGPTSSEPGGDRARASQSPSMAPYPYYYEPQAVLAEVSVADPAQPKLVRTITTDGSFANARLNGRYARVVISTPPRAIYEEPQPDGTRSTKSADWRAMSRIRNARTGKTARKVLVKCRQVRRTASFSGFGMISVITFDLSKGLVPIDSDALMTEAQTVYGSDKSLYVATQRYSETWANPDGSRPPAELRTAIHRFDISDPEQTVYRASGDVNGYLLNQFSLSEYKGRLRVASTEQPIWWGGEQARSSESFVTVLEEQGSRLLRVGGVGGLGKGERIYSVRFIDDKGFVVTFRQVDPLYTLDLENPAAPKVLGELKILGYSAYLHPAGKDLLIGIGQDATEDGRRAGSQISLFDVSDMRNPKRLHQYAIGSGSSSEAEYDHHAFLWWPSTSLAVLPMQIYGGGCCAQPSEPGPGSSQPSPPPFVGAVGFSVKADAGIQEAGRITHPAASNSGGYSPPISRSMVIGNSVYTLSDAGLKASALDTLADRAYVPFG